MTKNGRKFLLQIFGLTVFFLCGFFLVSKISAVDDPCASKSGNDKVACYDNLVNQLNSQAKTLANQIAQYDAQIKLTTFKISQTQDQVILLGGRINQLGDSLTSLTTAFSSRAVETYKLSKFQNNFVFILSASDLNDAVSRLHYLQKIQEEDRSLLEKLQTAQTTYEGQKQDQETLQKQLQSQQTLLNNQKKDKANLLAVTKNNESTFASLRNEAIAELAIVSGYGKETYIRDVNTGDKIGTIISGSSACSTGSHLHFEIHQGDNYVDPNNFLSSTSFSYSYSDQGYYGSINPHGSWPWPISQPIEINQGYGSTGYARDTYPNDFHQGIDMDSGSSNEVKAVHTGKLYGGSYNACGGKLSYGKIDNGDGTTVWYLHMIPQ